MNITITQPDNLAVMNTGLFYPNAIFTTTMHCGRPFDRTLKHVKVI